MSEQKNIGTGYLSHQYHLSHSPMNTDTTSYWNIKKEKLKLKYENLSDKDLYCSEGKEKEMIRSLSNKLGKTEKELLTIIVTI
jgi:hypothetical protein